MYKITTIRSAEAHKVRYPVLREGMPFETAVFPGDDAPDTFHVGCYYKDTPVGTVTFIKRANEALTAVNPYQLRGMAVLQNHQKKGLGELMIKEGEKLLLARSGDLIWLNARKAAMGFYEKMGYEAHGNVFMEEGIGLHYLMFKRF